MSYLLLKSKFKWILINFDTSIFHYKKLNINEFKKIIILLKIYKLQKKNLNFF